MTCIVGVVHKNKVYIGGDSAGVSNLDVIVRADSKVFTNRDFVFGFTSSFRMGQLLRYSFTPPTRKEHQDVYEYMVTKFINQVRKCFRAGGYAKKNNEVESGGTFLVGYHGRLFTIYDDFQVAESVQLYDAVGCGESYALGSLFATKLKEPKARIQLALSAAEQFSGGVRGPFKIEVQKN